MKKGFLLAALIGSAGVALIVQSPTKQDFPIVPAGLDPSLLLHAAALPEGAHEFSIGEASGLLAQEAPVGETATESALYASEQDLATMPAQWRAIYDHENATRGPEQPIPFNHRFHVTDLQIDCMYCHTGTERSVSGIVPSMDVCMGCHRVAGTGLPPVEEMREMDAAGEVIEWNWVYKLPEFAQFSHKAHLRNLECQDCHGPVEAMDRVYQWAPLTMGWCLDCHRQSPVGSDVATDYSLALASPPPQSPEGNQPDGFYPYAIDTGYGRTRGPTDCAACHF